MSFSEYLSRLDSTEFFFVGIKGTGMTALAELLHAKGASLEGSDVADRFFTDDILESIGIEVAPFDSDLPEKAEVVVFSTAYNPERHPQLLQAARLGLPLIPYHQALGAISSLSYSVAVTGVHGKTTTSAMIGTLIKGTALPASILAGSGVKNFGGKAVHLQGTEYFVAEACEYQRHFLHFSPDLLLVTSVEADHLDYFHDREDVLSAFLELGQKLPSGGQVLYCADQAGAVEVYQRLELLRPDLVFYPYGTSAEGDFKVELLAKEGGFQQFSLALDSQVYRLPIPGHHNILNAASALAVCSLLAQKEGIDQNHSWFSSLAQALEDFQSTRRRSEILYRSPKITIIDDYGHHPTAVKSTLAGFREFYPHSRIILSFMHHTYSRTKALYKDWLDAFADADIVLNHPIYASAREEKDPSVSGQKFSEDLSRRQPQVHYFAEFQDAADWLEDNRKPGDVFITMGAGDNWKVGQLLIKTIGSKEFS